MSDEHHEPIELPTWIDSSGHVTCTYDWGSDGSFLIIEYWADPQGEGHGTRALHELRGLHKTIHVVFSEDSKVGWWVNRAREGLVDSVTDFDDKVHWPIPSQT